MIRPVIFATFLCLTLVPQLVFTQSFTGLKFGDDGYSVISFSPDMSQFTDKFSVCVWKRELREEGHPITFAYKQNELFFHKDVPSDYVRYRVFGSDTYIREEQFQTQNGAWVQWCGTWSLESRTFRMYINGTLASYKITDSGRKLQTGGKLVLGDYWDPAERGLSNHHFGGEMFGFNMFSKELTGEEIAELSTYGLCTDIPERLERYRLLRWEDILLLPRRGHVQNIRRGCDDAFISEKRRLELSLEEARAELQKVQDQLDRKLREIEDLKNKKQISEREHNGTKAELESITLELRESEAKLEETGLKLNGTETKLEETELKLNGTQTKLKETEMKLNGTETKLEETELKLNGTETKLEETELKLNVTETKLEETELKLNGTETKLEETELKLNGTETKLEETELKLNGTETKLEETELKLNGTETRLEETELKLNGTETKLEETELKLNGTETKLGETESKLNETEAELGEIKEDLGDTEVELEKIKLSSNKCLLKVEKLELEGHEIWAQLNKTREELDGTKSELQSSKEELNGTRNELEDTQNRLIEVEAELQAKIDCQDRPHSCPLKKGRLTKWDILYSCEYYNKVFTRRQQTKLRNIWKSLNTGRLLGIKVTDKFIKLIKNLDESSTCTLQ